MALSATETGGSASAAVASAPGRVELAHVAGYGGLRLSRPETTYKRTEGEEVKVKSREHDIKPELAGNFSKYLHDDLNNLIGMQRDMGDAEFRNLLNESGHGYYTRLFDELTKLKSGTGGRERSIDAEKFRKYMASEPGLTMAYQVTLRKLQEAALPAGVYLQMQPPGHEPEMVEEASVTTGKGGPIREAARKARHALNTRVDRPYERNAPTRLARPLGWVTGGRIPGIRSVLDVAGANAGLGLLGAALGESSLLGGIVGLVAGSATTGTAYLARRGETLNIVQSAKALRGMLGDPTSSDPGRQAANPHEVEFSRRFLKLDPHDIEIVGPAGAETVQIRAGATTSLEDFRSLGEDLMGYAKDIIEFQASNHIRRNQIEPMDIRWLIEGADSPPQQATGLQERVMRRFRELGGVRDTAGVEQKTFVPATGDWEPTAGFNAANMDIPRNIATWNEAYTEIMMDDINTYFQGLMDQEAKPKESRDAKIAARATEYGPTTEAARLRKTEITREQEALTAGKTIVEGARGGFTTYQDHVRTQRRTIVQNERTVQSEQRKVQVIGGPADIDQALAQILTNPAAAFTVRIGTEVIGALSDVHQQIQADINADYTGWYGANIQPDMAAAQAARAAAVTPEALAAANQDITSLTQQASAYREQLNTVIFKNRLDTYNRQLNLVTGVMDRMRGARDNIETAREDLEDRDSEQRAPVERLIEGMQRDRTAIEGWSAGPIDLGTNALAGETFNVLQARINAAHAAAIAMVPPVTDVGWPPGENNNPRNHERLTRAMIEARAVISEPRIAAPSGDFNTAMGPPYDFAELDFMALSDQEIADRIALLGVPGLPMATIQAIRQEVQARLTARQRALPEVIEQIEARERDLTAESGRIDTEGVLPPRFEVIKKASARVDVIIPEITSVSADRFNALIAPAPAGTQPDNYIAAEQAYPIIYANILRWVADTAHDYTARFPGAAVGQEAAVARASNFLTPAVIDAEMIDALGTNMANLQAEVAAGNVSQTQFANFIVDRLIFEYMEPILEAA